VTTPDSAGQPLSTTQLPDYFAFQKSSDATTLYMQAIRLVIGPAQSGAQLLMSADGKELLNPGLKLDDVHQVSISFTGITKLFRGAAVKASEATLPSARNSSRAKS
jgi:hypothetical protein